MTEKHGHSARSDDLHAMRDIADGLIEAAGGEPLGRVADILLVEDEDGTYRCAAIMIGPEALAGRVANRLRPWLHRLLRGRFEHQIDIAEILEFGPTLVLRQTASHYQVGHADRWVIDHIIRFIPGHGRAS
jgi:hypothetical protein